MTMLRREDVKKLINDLDFMGDHNKREICAALDALPAAEPERAEGGERDDSELSDALASHGVTQDAVLAMEALFQFSEAMDKGVTIADLMAVMRMAIEEGHDIFLIQLAMASQAMELVNSDIAALRRKG